MTKRTPRQSIFIKRTKEDWVKMFEAFEKSDLGRKDFLDAIQTANRRTFDKNYDLYKKDKETYLKPSKKLDLFEKVEIDKEKLMKEATAIRQSGYDKLKKDMAETKRIREKELFKELGEGNYFI